MKALKGFQMRQTGCLEKRMLVYNVRKLHRPHMSDAFLDDSVGITSASLELHNNCSVQWIARSVNRPKKTCTADAL